MTESRNPQARVRLLLRPFSDDPPSYGATMFRLLAVTLALGVALLGSVHAKHAHHHGKTKIKGTAKVHELHKDKHHSVHAHTGVVKGKVKVKHVNAVHHHKGKPDKVVKVRKFKSKKKYHAAAPGQEQHYY